jgi:hypothetical protein
MTPARARVVEADVPFPIESEDEVVAPILAAVTARTRLALLAWAELKRALRSRC